MRQFLPNAIEVVPAMVSAKVAKRLRAAHPDLRIIGGGLIENLREIEDLFAAGINSVTASDPPPLVGLKTPVPSLPRLFDRNNGSGSPPLKV